MLYGFTEHVTTSHAFGTIAAWIEEGDTYINIYILGLETHVWGLPEMGGVWD